MFSFIKQIIEFFIGKKSDKDLKEVQPLVDAINEVYPSLATLSNDELRGKTQEFQGRISEYLADIETALQEHKSALADNPDMDPEQKETHYDAIDKLDKEHDEALEEVLEELLPEAFAVVRETARRFSENERITSTATQLDRDLAVHHNFLEIEGDQVTYKNSWTAAGGEITWNMVHYDVQLIGGIVLHKGRIAEMATGEGKTLVATLPAYLNGIARKGVHVVTVNNYLALRDSEWMAPIFNFLGLTVDCIDKYRPHSAQRRKAYNANITYGTNNEFGFDYLRDNMVRNPNELVQGKKHFAMIDEVDSVLIDDARTPLIISGPVERGDEHQFDVLKPRIEGLYKAQRDLVRGFLVNARKKIAEGNSKVEEGGGGLDLLRAFRGLPRNKRLIKYLNEQGIKQVLLDTENFYLQEQAKNMPQVDKELYFIIEEKQNQVTLTDKGIEFITGANEDSDLFVMADIGSVMADIENDTELNEQDKVMAKDKAMQDFSIKSERLHSVQQLLKAYTLFEKDTEYVVMDGQVKIVDEGTGRIMEGRRYSDGLHQAIEAKESVKIEAATQTFATVTLQNFFRMYHKLSGMTGTAETEAGEFWEIYELDVVVIPTNRPIVRDDREDLVYRTNREKYAAVIDEVIRLTKEGRPVLVGTTSVEISELLSRILQRQRIKHNVLNAKNHLREAEIVAEAGRAGAVTIATNMAGRGTDIKLSSEVKEAGGLAIVGTERHDSRRVDRQLRGRSGRQGDPGSSQFYVSLEDKLMRIFGSDRVASVMDRLGHQEGEAIQHSMITKSIERAQKKVEENNFGMRKRLLDYDEVMNVQRTAVYDKRRHALFGERLSVDLHATFAELADEIVAIYKPQEDAEGLKMDIIRSFALETNITAVDLKNKSVPELGDMVYAQAADYYKRRMQGLVNAIMPLITMIYEREGNVDKIIPFTDGRRVINVLVNMEKAVQSQGRELTKELEKTITLALLDDSWKTHLREMDELKQAVQTATYEQKDPLLIYKGEAYGLFKSMLSKYYQDLTSFLFRANIPIQRSEEVKTGSRQNTDMSRMRAAKAEAETENTQRRKAAENAGSGEDGGVTAPIRRDTPKVGRNELCPCGSGKKYKKCHGRKERVVND